MQLRARDICRYDVRIIAKRKISQTLSYIRSFLTTVPIAGICVDILAVGKVEGVKVEVGTA